MFRGEAHGRARTGMRKRHVCMHACVCQAETSLTLCRNSIAARLQGLGVFLCSWLSFYAPLHTHTHPPTPTLKMHCRSNFIMSGQEHTCPIHEN